MCKNNKFTKNIISELSNNNHNYISTYIWLKYIKE
jgi:hypothetical protein